MNPRPPDPPADPPVEPGAEGKPSGPTPRVLATFVTTSAYGTRLPGDPRGTTHDAKPIPTNPRLELHARGELWHAPVTFSHANVIALDHAIRSAATEFGYRLTDLAVESNHLHWIIEHGFDPVPKMVARLKARMRQFLNRGRIWTEGYHHRCLYSQPEIETCRNYIARHPGCRLLNGKSTV